jgi:hypothetical protein
MKVALVLLAACHASAPAGLVDVSASLEPVKRDFDAHAGEARFLTLLSPT